eukprot:gene2346-1475_t
MGSSFGVGVRLSDLRIESEASSPFLSTDRFRTVCQPERGAERTTSGLSPRPPCRIFALQPYLISAIYIIIIIIIINPRVLQMGSLERKLFLSFPFIYKLSVLGSDRVARRRKSLPVWASGNEVDRDFETSVREACESSAAGRETGALTRSKDNNILRYAAVAVIMAGRVGHALIKVCLFSSYRVFLLHSSTLLLSTPTHSVSDCYYHCYSSFSFPLLQISFMPQRFTISEGAPLPASRTAAPLAATEFTTRCHQPVLPYRSRPAPPSTECIQPSYWSRIAALAEDTIHKLGATHRRRWSALSSSHRGETAATHNASPSSQENTSMAEPTPHPVPEHQPTPTAAPHGPDTDPAGTPPVVVQQFFQISPAALFYPTVATATPQSRIRAGLEARATSQPAPHRQLTVVQLPDIQPRALLPGYKRQRTSSTCSPANTIIQPNSKNATTTCDSPFGSGVPAAPSKAPFSFGAPSSAPGSTTLGSGDAKAAPPSNGFFKKGPPAVIPDDSGFAPNAGDEDDKGSDKPSTQPAAAAKPGFAFGASSGASSAPSPFGSGAPAAPSKAPFSFGAPSSAPGSTTLGSGDAKAAPPSNGFFKKGPPAVIPDDSGFAPNAGDEDDKGSDKPSTQPAAAAKPGFAFGAPSGASSAPSPFGSGAPAAPSKAPFSFGAPSSAPGSTTLGSGDAKAAPPSNGFFKKGPPAVIPDDSGFAPNAGDEDDKGSDKPSTQPAAAAKPGFAFGAPSGASSAPSPFGSGAPAAPSKAPFSFGAPSSAPGSTTLGSGDAKAAPPSNGFFKKGPPAVIPDDSGFAPNAGDEDDKGSDKPSTQPAAAAKPGFAFGAPSGASSAPSPSAPGSTTLGSGDAKAAPPSNGFFKKGPPAVIPDDSGFAPNAGDEDDKGSDKPSTQPAAAAKPGFAFGAPSGASSAPSPFGSGAPAAPSKAPNGFFKKGPPAVIPDDSGFAPNAGDEDDKGSDKPSTQPAAAAKPGFAFGAPSGASSAPSPFGSGAPAAPSKAPFSFGAPSSAPGSTTLGSEDAKAAPPSNGFFKKGPPAVIPDDSGFAPNAGDEDDKGSDKPSTQPAAAAKPGFAFGAPSGASSAPSPSAPGSTTLGSGDAKAAPPSNGFFKKGPPAVIPDDSGFAPNAGDEDDKGSDKPSTQPAAAAKPGFAFGAPSGASSAPSPFGSGAPAAPSKAPFSFGAPSSAPGSTTPGSGAPAAASGAFVFGGSPLGSSAKPLGNTSSGTSSAPSPFGSGSPSVPASAFVFGGSSSGAAASVFGKGPSGASSAASPFGSSATTGGSSVGTAFGSGKPLSSPFSFGSSIRKWLPFHFIALRCGGANCSPIRLCTFIFGALVGRKLVCLATPFKPLIVCHVL